MPKKNELFSYFTSQLVTQLFHHPTASLSPKLRTAIADSSLSFIHLESDIRLHYRFIVANIITAYNEKRE